jgi:hypothetical protein
MSTADGEKPSLLRLAAAAAGIAAANAGRQVALSAAGYLVVAGLFAASLCFLTVAAHRAIAVALGEIQASLIVGCAYLGLGLFVALLLAVRR